MATWINELTKNDAGIIFKERRNWDKKTRLLASIDKARKTLSYEPKTEFEKDWVKFIIGSCRTEKTSKSQRIFAEEEKKLTHQERVELGIKVREDNLMAQEKPSRHKRACLFYIISWWEYLLPSGMAARIDGLVSQLRRVDIKPTVITPIFREYDTGLSSRETNNIRTLDLRWLSARESLTYRSLKSIPESILKLVAVAVFSVFSFVIIATEFLVKGRKRQLIVQYQDVFAAPPALLAGFLLGATIVGDDCAMRSLKDPVFPRFSWFQKAYETFVLKHTDFVVTSFKLDFRLIKSIRKDRNVLFVPNGIRVQPELAEVTRNPECLIFVGQFAVIDNIEALDDVLYIADRLFEKLSAWKIYVVGGPAETVRDAVRRNGSKTENIRFLGRISQEKLDMLYRQAIIGLLPYFGHLRHTSQRIKALEYLSNRLLVVASPKGVDGFEGLTEGKHYILAKTREDMILRLEEALLNYASYAQIADAGRDFVIQNYTWEKVAEPYLNLIEHLVQQASSVKERL